jgi:hypothetical protein
VALVKCTECGGEISTQAKTCPNCGAPPKKKTSLLVKVLGFVFFSAMIFVVVIPSINTTPKRPPPTVKATPTPAAPKPKPKPNPSGNWEQASSISKIDDSNNVHLSLKAVLGFRSGYKVGRANLWIACRENKTNAFINYGIFITTDETDVMLRFDGEKAFTESWTTSTDYEAAFSRAPLRFVKKLLSSSRLLVQITPHGEDPVTTEVRWPKSRHKTSAYSLRLVGARAVFTFLPLSNLHKYPASAGSIFRGERPFLANTVEKSISMEHEEIVGA